jgi:hypothetical protein
MDDLFNWGNDKFVLGRQLADKNGNSTVKRKKTPQEVFMEAILDEEPVAEPVKVEATHTEEEAGKGSEEYDEEIDGEPKLDRDSIGGASTGDEEL